MIKIEKSWGRAVPSSSSAVLETRTEFGKVVKLLLKCLSSCLILLSSLNCLNILFSSCSHV